MMEVMKYHMGGVQSHKNLVVSACWFPTAGEWGLEGHFVRDLCYAFLHLLLIIAPEQGTAFYHLLELSMG